MHILQLEIDNFKSFYGKTTIPFRRGFTTVSGPNGSGKSNIVDSLLFCLGLSTSRTMRAEKLTDLINNSTRKREASVTVTFSKQAIDPDLPTPEDEARFASTDEVAPSPLAGFAPESLVTISRRIRETASGTQSTYVLNGRVATLAEIHEFLAQFNVSPGCYNVMMQGDVASIVTMSGVERRKILDELAGIGEFDRKIDQATAELTTTGATIERNNILLGEIQERLGQLEGERDKALKYQSLKQQVQSLEQQLNLVRLRELKKALTASQLNLEQSKDARKQALTELETQKRAIQSSTTRLQELTDAVKRKGEDQHLAIQRQVESLRNHIARKQDSITFLQQQSKDADTQTLTHKQEIIKQQQGLETLAHELALQAQQEQELLGFFTQQEDAYKALSHQFDNLTNNESGWAVQRQDTRQNLEQVSDALAEAKRELMTVLAKQENLQQQQAQKEQSTLQQESQKQALQRRYSELSSSFEGLDQDKEAREAQVRHLQQQRSTLWAELNLAKDEQSQAQNELVKQESRKRAMEEVQFGRAVDVVLSSRLEGVIGTVGQLVDVPEAYATALEVALGGRLQNIVVENDTIAQQCIRFLQQQRVGTATFLPLNKLRAPMRLGNPPVEGGVVDYAVNLVTFDREYDAVFSMALGDTLVMETIESARRLLNRYRMVTLDGSVLEKSGAMSGGSHGGGRGSKGRALFQAASLEKQLEQLEQTFNAAKQKRHRLEEQLNKVEAQLETAQAELRTMDVQHSRTLAELESLEKQMEPAKQGATSLNASVSAKDEAVQLEVLRNQQALLEKQLPILEQQQANLQGQLHQIDEQAQGSAVQELRDQLSEAKFQMDYYDSQLRQLRAEIKQKQSDEQIRQNVMEEHGKQIEQKAQKQQQWLLDIATHQQDIVTTTTQTEALEAQTLALDEELQALKAERDEAQGQLLHLERQRNQHERKVLQLEEQLLACQARCRELEPKLASLSQQLTPLYPQGLEQALNDLPETAENEHMDTINGLEKKLKALEPVNMLAIKEFENVNQRQEQLAEKVNTLSRERDTLLAKIASYEELKRVNFSKTFDQVNTHFQAIYGELAEGLGQLVLTNPEDPLSGGLTIEASPRGKKMQRLEAMSGGEKSLTSLAFVFSLQRTMPAPFYALDEVDQNLDGLNVEKLSSMVKREAASAQFIVVSLRKPMIENSDRTVGVTQKQNGISKVTGVQFRLESVGALAGG
jgi:chromosome segregation protein